MDYNAADKENVGDVLKRRSSILKTRDDPTQNPTTTNLTRRISFHNRLKIQEYDRHDGIFCTEQEEQLHLTSNSDGFRNLTFSDSLVAGPLDNELNDLTLTLLHGPQAFSTPAVGHVPPSAAATAATSNDDPMDDGTTMQFFDGIRAAPSKPAAANETYAVVGASACAAAGMPDIADRTCAVFDAFRPPIADATGDESTFQSSPQPVSKLQPHAEVVDDGMDVEAAVDPVEESRWSNRFYDSGGESVLLNASVSQVCSPSAKRDGMCDGSMFTDVTEKMMAQANAYPREASIGSILVPFGESIMAMTGTVDVLSRSRSRRFHSNETAVRGAAALDMSALREPLEEDITLDAMLGTGVDETMDAFGAGAVADDQPIGDFDCTPIGSAQADSAKPADATFTVAGPSTLAVEAASERAANIDSAGYTTIQREQVPQVPPAATPSSSDVSSATITVHKSITEDISVFGSSLRKPLSFHRRRRSSVFVSVAVGSVSASASPSGQLAVKPSTLPIGLAERRKSLLIQQSDGLAGRPPVVDSPTIIVDTDDNFNVIVIEVDERQMEEARQNHARKCALYAMMNATLARIDALRAEEARLDAELKSSFGELIAKIQ